MKLNFVEHLKMFGLENQALTGIKLFRDFPGDPGIETLYFQHRVSRFDSWESNSRELRFHMPRGHKIKKKNSLNTCKNHPVVQCCFCICLRPICKSLSNIHNLSINYHLSLTFTMSLLDSQRLN